MNLRKTRTRRRTLTLQRKNRRYRCTDKHTDNTDFFEIKKKMEYLFEKETETIIGIQYDVFNALCWGLREKHYERAIMEEARVKNIPCLSQVRKKVMYKGRLIGYNYADLLFYGKILVELKVGNALIKRDFDQLNEYLKENNIQIGLLVLFSPTGVVIRRLANIKK